jgi:hypothetical protein
LAKKKRKPAAKPSRSNEWTAKQVEAQLLSTSFPRSQMMLILALAALGTFFSSASLVAMGLGSMGVRYALAVVGGYSFFLLLVRLWIAYQTRNWSFGRSSSEPARARSSSRSDVGNFDLPDLSAFGDLAGSVQSGFAGGGGEFGGAGASASFDVDGSGDSGASGALEALGGADEGLPILLAIIAVLGGLIALGFVVYSSPLLFAEVLLDVAVVGAVYRKNKRHERGHWAAGVLRRTYKPMLVLSVLAAVFGFAMQSLAPDQHTLGAVLEAREARKNAS